MCNWKKAIWFSYWPAGRGESRVNASICIERCEVRRGQTRYQRSLRPQDLRSLQRLAERIKYELEVEAEHQDRMGVNWSERRIGTLP